MSTLNLLFIATFIFSTLLILAIYSFLRWLFVGNEDRVSQRLAALTKDKDVRSSEIPFVLRNDELSRIPILNRWLQKLHVSKNLRQLINQADISITVGELILCMLIFGGLGLLLGVKLNNYILSAGCLFLLGSFPLLYVSHRRRKRLKLFTGQFPDALDMMTSALRAGHSIGRAFQLVASEAPDPVGMEFRRTFEEQNLGLPMKEALMNMTQRIDSVDLKLFITAVVIQRESGGNMTEILSKISHTIRERFRLLGQIKVFTAQGRFTGWILGTLPIALGFIVSVFNPDYIMLLFQEPLGQYMIGLAVFLQVVGFIFIRKIVRMKVH
jgi:tight adherence protein B